MCAPTFLYALLRTVHNSELQIFKHFFEVDVIIVISSAQDLFYILYYNPKINILQTTLVPLIAKGLSNYNLNTSMPCFRYLEPSIAFTTSHLHFLLNFIFMT